MNLEFIPRLFRVRIEIPFHKLLFRKSMLTISGNNNSHTTNLQQTTHVNTRQSLPAFPDFLQDIQSKASSHQNRSVADNNLSRQAGNNGETSTGLRTELLESLDPKKATISRRLKSFAKLPVTAVKYGAVSGAISAGISAAATVKVADKIVKQIPCFGCVPCGGEAVGVGALAAGGAVGFVGGGVAGFGLGVGASLKRTFSKDLIVDDGFMVKSRGVEAFKNAIGNIPEDRIFKDSNNELNVTIRGPDLPTYLNISTGAESDSLQRMVMTTPQNINISQLKASLKERATTGFVAHKVRVDKSYNFFPKSQNPDVVTTSEAFQGYRSNVKIDVNPNHNLKPELAGTQLLYELTQVAATRI